MSRAARLMCGLLLVLVPTVEFGGQFLLRSLVNPASGYTANVVREDLFRAGHAHAGVLLVLALVGQILADSVALPALMVWLARLGLVFAPLLMSAGFFLSMPSVTATAPNGMIALVYSGGVVLALAILTLAIGLLRTPRSA